MKDTLFPIQKDLLAKLHKANSEPTVRQLVIQQLDCDDIELEKSGTDALHKNILFEFKHDEDMRYKDGDRAKVLAQALYYCHHFYFDGDRVQPPTLPSWTKTNSFFMNGKSSNRFIKTRHCSEKAMRPSRMRRLSSKICFSY